MVLFWSVHWISLLWSFEESSRRKGSRFGCLTSLTFVVVWDFVVFKQAESCVGVDDSCSVLTQGTLCFYCPVGRFAGDFTRFCVESMSLLRSWKTIQNLGAGVGWLVDIWVFFWDFKIVLWQNKALNNLRQNILVSYHIYPCYQQLHGWMVMFSLLNTFSLTGQVLSLFPFNFN